MHKSRRHGLDAMGALATLLASSTVRLNQANVDPPEDTVLLTDFSEATFVGYVAATVVAWSADGIDPDGVPYMLSGTLHFEATSAATPNVIYGVYTEHGVAPTIPDVYGLFAAPIPINLAGDAVNCTIKYRLDGLVTLINLAGM